MIFNRRINLFRNRFARESTRKAADNSTCNCSNRPCGQTGRCPRRCAADCCTNARADRMCTRLVGDWIAIFVTIDIVTHSSHDKTSRGSKTKTILHQCAK
jgi:hypothetical protein